jgi:hypothetical protein
MSYDSEENRKRWMWMAVRATPFRRFLQSDGWCDDYLSAISAVREGRVEHEVISGNAHDVMITASQVTVENDYDQFWQTLEYSLDEFETLIRAFALEKDFLQKEIGNIGICLFLLSQVGEVRNSTAKEFDFAGKTYTVHLTKDQAKIFLSNDRAKQARLTLDEFEGIIRQQLTRIEKM